MPRWISPCTHRTIRTSPARHPALDDRELAISWHHEIETVPTVLRVVDGVEVERTVGWQRPEWERITGVDRSRRRSPGVPPRLRIDERRPRSRRRAAGAVRRVGARVAAHRRGRRRGRHRDDVRPRLERRAAGRAADRGAGHADADRHHSCAVRRRRGRAAGPRGDDRREGGDRRGDGRLQAGVPPVGADRRRGGVHRASSTSTACSPPRCRPDR